MSLQLFLGALVMLVIYGLLIAFCGWVEVGVFVVIGTVGTFLWFTKGARL